MAEKSLPKNLENHYGKIRIRIGRHYKKTTTLSPASDKDIRAANVKAKEAKALLKYGVEPELSISEDPKFSRFEAARDEYLSLYVGKDSTKGLYAKALELFWMKHFKGRMLASITQREIKIALASKKCGKKTKENYLTPLANLFTHFEISPNPARGISHTKKSAKDSDPKVDRYTNTERTKLIQNATGDFQIYLVCLFACGFRPGEGLGLQKGDFDPKTQIWHLQRQVTNFELDLELKTYHERFVFMPDWALPYIRKHLKKFDNDDDFLFVRKDGTPHYDRKSLYYQFEQLHIKAKVPLQRPGLDKRELYVCRHTRASELLSIGTSRGEAAEQLGHTPEMFDRKYARFIREFSGKKDYKHLNGPGLVHGGLRAVGDE